MKARPPRHLIVPAAIVFVATLALGWHVIGGTDHPSLDPAAITAVRAHALTPSTIVTTARLAARGGCPTSVVSFQSDGLQEYALAERPASALPVGGYPVIIFAHGYTSPTNYATANTQYQAMLSWYCSHGYLVLKPDYRGYGQSAGKPANGLYAPDDTYDVLNLAASLPSYALANPHRIALVGHSMGGGVVLRANVASHQLPIKAVVTVAGAVASLSDLTYHWSGGVPPDVQVARRQMVHLMGPPNQAPGYWHDGSAINYVSADAAPIQIDQGLADASVPATFASKLDYALTAAHQTHEYFTYPNTGHLFGNQAAMDLLLSRSTAFLTTYDR